MSAANVYEEATAVANLAAGLARVSSGLATDAIELRDKLNALPTLDLRIGPATWVDCERTSAPLVMIEGLLTGGALVQVLVGTMGRRSAAVVHDCLEMDSVRKLAKIVKWDGGGKVVTLTRADQAILAVRYYSKVGA